MIAHLRGTLLEKRANQIVVDCGGVGYDVTVPISTYTALGDVGAEVKLRIHTVVREDAFLLYGFLTADEKALFEKLISVTGVGPKLGVTVLSGLSTPNLILAIRGGDVAGLTRVPGIGKKTAERLVLELKDKLEGIGGGAVAAASPAERPAVLSALEQDVLSALVNLGCQKPAAEVAVKKAKAAGAPDEFEVLFRKSLELVR